MRPLLWQDVKAICLEALVTRRNIISDIARNTNRNSKIRDILRRKVTESAHRVINKLIGQRRKRIKRHSIRDEK